MKTSTFFIFTFLHTSSALIGYDCGGSTLNITTFSTVDKPKCDYVHSQPTNQEIQIQLLQIVDYGDTHVQQCRVEIDSTVYYCGMHSHTSAVHNGRQQYILPTSRGVCQTMHESGALFLSPSTQIFGLVPNSTNSRSITLAGSIQQDGTCGGSTYSDPFGTWDNVVVQAVVKITIKDQQTVVKLLTDEIILPSGQRCPLSKESCMDTEDGYTFWTAMPSTQCKFDEFSTLYEGRAVKTTSTNGSSPPQVEGGNLLWIQASGGAVCRILGAANMVLLGEWQQPLDFGHSVGNVRDFNGRRGL